ncbi:MAG: hypothetical protein Q7J32_17555 [Sphingomonadaceae bacterium]|nr:hypothetical protein [Sphingomonadaceae bacterium]
MKDRNGPKVPLMRLWERTSANGNRYFAGYMGQASVVMFHDEKAEGEHPQWQLYVSEAPNNRRSRNG